MQLQTRDPELADGDYLVYVNGSNMRNGGRGFAVIQLDKDGHVDLAFDEPGEFDEIIIAASAAKQMLINARRPHSYHPGGHDSRCLDCGVLKNHHVEPAPADEEWRLTPKGAEAAESWPPAVVTDAQLAAAIISVSDRVPIENLAPYALAKRLIAAMDADAVITDSERDCDQRNPDGSGEPCHRGGDHGVHRDSNGDEWRTDVPAVTR